MTASSTRASAAQLAEEIAERRDRLGRLTEQENAAMLRAEVLRKELVQARARKNPDKAAIEKLRSDEQAATREASECSQTCEYVSREILGLEADQRKAEAREADEGAELARDEAAEAVGEFTAEVSKVAERLSDLMAVTESKVNAAYSAKLNAGRLNGRQSNPGSLDIHGFWGHAASTKTAVGEFLSSLSRADVRIGG